MRQVGHICNQGPEMLNNAQRLRPGLLRVGEAPTHYTSYAEHAGA